MLKDEPLLTVNEAAEYLRLNPRTVSNKAQQGIIPAKKVAGKWRFTVDAIRNFSDSHECYATNSTANTQLI